MCSNFDSGLYQADPDATKCNTARILPAATTKADAPKDQMPIYKTATVVAHGRFAKADRVTGAPLHKVEQETQEEDARLRAEIDVLATVSGAVAGSLMEAKKNEQPKLKSKFRTLGRPLNTKLKLIKPCRM